jgi:uncharacterized protein (TIGR02246 family)
MKKLFALIVFAFVAGSAAFGQGSELSLDPGVKAHAGIDAVYAKFSRAYRDLDHELVGSLYTLDAAYLVPEQDLTTGRENITPTFKSFFDYIKERSGRLSISFRIVQRRATKDMAYDVGIYTLTTTDAAGKSTSGQGKFVVVAVKEKNGEWRFQVDGYSDLAKPKEQR